ncbi:DEAD/DEAH box helicase family protein [Candidatus Saccharibacteria bacterium]|jgi:type III restriction enzyme|nr:DEAD/DEAH box helicase family protein [Candidatus Saccharibacteria bacterium]
MSLWQALTPKLEDWRESNYKCDNYPAIAEILRYQRHEDGSSRYLRIPQIEALEMYWFIRLVLKTPRLLDLYKLAFDDPQELASALGVKVDVRYADIGKILEDAVNDSHVAKEFNLEHIIESLQLDYPSYIMALTMGTGKTVLIGSIIASEFAMSIEYPEANFMKNALVFAPGTTIIGSLKELSDVPYAQILPPRFYKKFLANLKITYAQTGSKTIQIDQGGTYHVVVTNTEKIILKKPARKKNQSTLEFKTLEEQYKLTENQRLAAIKSLPNLGIFSDEAQNTYGSKLDEELKRVRATIDYLHAERNLV